MADVPQTVIAYHINQWSPYRKKRFGLDWNPHITFISGDDPIPENARFAWVCYPSPKIYWRLWWKEIPFVRIIPGGIPPAERRLKPTLGTLWAFIRQKIITTLLFLSPRPESTIKYNADYQEWFKIMGQMNTWPPRRDKYAVYIDSDDFRSGDNKYRGGTIPEWEGEFYHHLNRYLNWIEDTYGVEVVIAAHPLREYDNFMGRKVFYDLTAHLVKDARFVIMQSSTAVNLAVLWRKPVIFVTTKKYADWVMGPVVEAMAHALNQRVVMMDEPYQKPSLYVEEPIYQSYEEHYIL